MKKIEPRKTLIVTTSFWIEQFFFCFLIQKFGKSLDFSLLVQIQLSLFNFLGKENSQFVLYDKIEFRKPWLWLRHYEFNFVVFSNPKKWETIRYFLF